MTMGGSTLCLRGVDAFYGRTQALFDVDMDASAGQVTCLVGLNGMGKSTTLRSIAGWVETSGVVELDGVALPTRAHERAGRRIAYVPEDRRVFGSLTVEENLKVVKPGRRNITRGPHVDLRANHDVFELAYDVFPRLRERARQHARTLSGGEQQMLSVARAIVANPAFVLLDEPNEGLAPAYMDIISGAVRTLRELGVGIVLVEQSWAVAKALGDVFYLIENGHMTDRAVAEDLERDPKRIVSRMVIGGS